MAILIYAGSTYSDLIFSLIGIYVAFIIYTAISARTKKFWKATLSYLISFALAIVLSTLLVYFESWFYSLYLKGYYQIHYCLYYTVLFFVILSKFVFHKIFKVDDFKVVVPICIAIAIAKIGCSLNQCCQAHIKDVAIPLSLIESGLMITFMILILCKKVKINALLLTYFSIFRFFTDFIKDSYYYESVMWLSINQIIYIVVIAFTVFIYIKERKALNEKTQINYNN